MDGKWSRDNSADSRGLKFAFVTVNPRGEN
jgi:hypothetical protein